MSLTRSIDENTISDVNIYFYSDLKNYHYYYTEEAPAYELQMLPGTYQLFVITNVHKDLGDLTMAELQNYDYSAGDMVSDIPMTAKTNVTVQGATTIPAIQVKRAAAKIAYTISVDDAVASTIKLRSVQFCNLPKSLRLFGSSRVSTDTNDFSNGAILEIKNDKTFSDVYFLLENCQGTVASITKPTDKAPANAPACATYMRILADGPGKLMEYIVYLGENSTSNFDVRRNTKHTMNLYIKGENEIDNRVSVYEGLYYGKANCHISTGTKISFDATPYRTGKTQTYAYTGIYAGKEYEAAKADLLWEDVKGLVTNVAFNANNVTVTTTGAPGNAGVALYDKMGTIVWSFHIWCTDQPSLMYFKASSKNPNNSYVMMDRALGAKERGKTGWRQDNIGRGLVYQFGRKDPFPSWDWDLKGISKRYDRNGEQIPHTKILRETEDNAFEYCGTIAYTIANPLHFITASYNTDGGWVYPFFDFATNAILWGNMLPNAETYPDNSSLRKTIYDPCPEGYKVPGSDAYDVLVGGSSFYVDTENKSQEFYYNLVKGFNARGIVSSGTGYPTGNWCSGCRPLGGSLTTNTFYPFRYSDVNGEPLSHPCDAVAVRCVKE